MTETSLVASEAVKAALRLVTSSSPSYPLMVSMDQVARLLQEKQFILQVDQLKEFSEKALAELKKVDGFQAYDCDFKNDPLHMTLRIDGVKGSDLCKYFQSKGVFVESDLGSGCLLLAGLGNLEEDFRVVLKTARDNSFSLTGKVIQYPKPEEIVQKMNPKKAFFAASELIELNSLAGKIAAECYAPCPPGIPVLSPGALVPENINQFRSMIGKVRVVKE